MCTEWTETLMRANKSFITTQKISYHHKKKKYLTTNYNNPTAVFLTAIFWQYFIKIYYLLFSDIYFPSLKFDIFWSCIFESELFPFLCLPCPCLIHSRLFVLSWPLLPTFSNVTAFFVPVTFPLHYVPLAWAWYCLVLSWVQEALGGGKHFRPCCRHLP